MFHIMRSFFSKYKYFISLGVIFFIALFFRLYKLASLPVTFYEDELLIGYVGRFILQNGKDLYGNAWPLLYFNKFNDYYIIFPMYFAGLSSFVFGVSQFAVRFPTALLGSLIVFPVYGVATKVFQKKWIGVFAAGLIALSPWHIVLSRASTESILEATFVMTAVLLLMCAVEKKRILFAMGAVLLLLFSYVIYHTARMYTPMILLSFSLLYIRELLSKKVLFGFVIIAFLLSAVCTVYIAKTPWGSGRFAQTSIFTEQSGVMIRITQMTYNLGSNNLFLARIFHNKLFGFGREFLHQYFTYFSPEFLFFSGWSKTRYDVPESGPMLLLTGFCIVIAVVFGKTSGVRMQQKHFLFLLALLLIAPFPASLTTIESPNVRRTVFLAVPLMIFAAVGLYASLHLRWKKLMLFPVLLFLIVIEFTNFWYMYVKQSDRINSEFRSDRYPQAAQYLMKHKNEYEKMYIFPHGTMPLYYLFYAKDFRADFIGKFRFNVRIDSIDNLEFVEDMCTANVLGKQIIPAKSLIIQPDVCDVDQSKFVEIDRIYGVHELIFLRVLVPRSNM